MMPSNIKHILRFTAVLGLGVILGFSGSVYYYKNKLRSRPKHMKHAVTRVIKKLDLSSEKAAKVKVLFDNLGETMRKEGVRFREIIRKKNDSITAELKTILTTEEFERYQVLQKKYLRVRKKWKKHKRRKHRERREHRKHKRHHQPEKH